MYNLSLIQVNLVQGSCVNMLPPGNDLELNIELNHTVNTATPGQMTSVTKLTVSPKKIEPASPFDISFELRASYKAPTTLSSDSAFDESIHIMFPYLQTNLKQFCNLLDLPPISLPFDSIPSIKNKQ